MKRSYFRYTIILVLFWSSGYAEAYEKVRRDSTGVPGDNFSLEGALELFKTAKSPEEFEKLLNTEDNKVNNLDLNGDGEIDYVRVIDKSDKDAHAFILQATVSENENQDIAVIELEKKGDQNAALQIVGDEDIYGEETIVTPAEGAQASSPVPSGNTNVNVWMWPAVRYVYAPSYAVWVSPWGWRARPAWWRPWRPVRYAVFYPYAAPYRNHYVVVRRSRVISAHRIYAPVRTTSVIVRTRHQASITNYRTARETTIHRGGRRVTRTTTVQGPRGNVRTTKRTRVRRQ